MAVLVLGDKLRLKTALPVARDFYRKFAELALERLAAGAVAGVACRVSDRLMFGMPEVRGHLGLQGALHNGLGDLLEQAVFADQVFGFLVVSQQLVD